MSNGIPRMPRLRQFRRLPRTASLPGIRNTVRWEPDQGAVAEVPVAMGLNRRRTSFQLNISEVFSQPARRRDPERALDPGMAREDAYLRFIRRVPEITRPEFYVHQGLERKGLRSPYSDPPGMDFEYLKYVFTGNIPTQGVRESNFTQLDFVVYAVSPPVVLEVDGEIWHFSDVEARVQDSITRVGLQSLGYRVVSILAQDTMEPGRLDQVLTMAMLGAEVDPVGRTGVFK